jgi:hypothetical protein
MLITYVYALYFLYIIKALNRSIVFPSNEGAQSEEHSHVEGRGSGQLSLLLVSHKLDRVHVLEVLDVSVDHVPSKSLDSVVDLISVEMSPHVAECVVHPVLVDVTSIRILVVSDKSESLLQHVRVQQGVQLVTGSVECTNARTEFATVLLLGQVFYTRDRR